MADATAPDGQIFCCAACGKTSRTRYGMRDTSCITWAVLVDEASIERDTDGRVKRAHAVGTHG